MSKTLHNVCGNAGCGSTPVRTNNVCTQCFRCIYSNPDDTCPYSDCKHVVTNPPKYIPCILCLNLLEVDNSDVCHVCNTPQDYSVLQNMTYKFCSNSKCAVTLPFECMKCYRCGATVISPAIFFNQIKWGNRNSNLLEHLKTQLPKQAPTIPSSIASANKVKLLGAQEKYSRYCAQCFKPISESAGICPSCDHELVNAPQSIPCIVCSQMLEIDNCDVCMTCTTQQDYSVLQNMKFKSCCNDDCKRLIPFDIPDCCFCSSKQTDIEYNEQSNESTHCFDEVTGFFKPELLKYLKQKSENTFDQHSSNVEKLVTEESEIGKTNDEDDHSRQEDGDQFLKSQFKTDGYVHVDAEEKPSQKLSPCKISPYPAGFCDIDDPDQMCVTFKTIVPKKLWDWDEHSEIYMRFGGKWFGNFQHDFGPGKIEREDEQFLWFKFSQYIKSKYMRESHHAGSHCYLQYRYTVFTDKVTKLSDIFEVLQEVDKSPLTNRVLELEHSICRPTRKFVQCDTFVCPAASNVKDKNMTSFFSNQKVQRSFSTKSKAGIPNVHLDEMFQVCLTLFLLPVREMILQGDYGGNFNLSVEVNRVIAPVQLLYERKYMYSNVPSSSKFSVIKQEVEQWMEDILLNLAKLDNKESVHIPVCGALIIFAVLKCLNNKKLSILKIESVLKIFEIVAGSSSSNQIVQERIKSLGIFSKDVQSIILRFVIEEFQKLVDLKEKTINLQVVIILMKILPFIHFLSTTKVQSGVYSVIDNKLLKFVKQFLRKESGFKLIIDEVQPFIEVDPLLSYNLLFVCPTNHFCVLSNVVPLELFIGALAHNISRSYNEVQELVINPLLEIHKKIMLNKLEQHRIANVKDQLTKVSEALLAKATNIRLVDTKAYCIFCVIFTTFCCKQNENLPVDSNTLGLLDKWIEKRNLGKTFGNTRLQKMERECELWNCILEDSHVVALLDSSKDQSIKDNWTSIVKCILESRLSKISDEDVFGLFKVVDEGNNSELLCSVIMDRISTALDNLFENNPDLILEKLLKKGSNSKSIVESLGRLLTKKYPAPEKTLEITLLDLLSWKLWPGFLKLLVSFINCDVSKSNHGSSAKWQSICTIALTRFSSVCEFVKNGGISVHDIGLLRIHKSQVTELCSTLSSIKHFEIFDPTEMKTFIDVREKEYSHFLDFQANLLVLINRLRNLPIKGMDDLDSMIEESKDNHPINSLLCIKENGKFEIRCYQKAKPLFNHLRSFVILTKEYPNIIFDQFWERKTQEVAINHVNSAITFEDVVELIWLPVFHDITNFVQLLEKSKIKLSVLNEILKDKFCKSEKCRQESLQKELEQLSIGLRLCHADSFPDVSWIESTTPIIFHYWEMSGYSDYANVFLKYAKKLNLTGDFSIVSILSKGIDENKNLLFIDSSLIDISEFLKSFALDSQIKECLDAFVECPKIIKWIQTLGNKEDKQIDVQTNVNDLQNFVNIALATAAGGEGDLSTDKLINLRIVGSGFGPLIYNLPQQNAGYDILQSHCKNLWETLRQTRDLPAILRSCEDHIDWYTSVRETQGSVEKTSFGQMRNINQLGVYEVGSIRVGQLSSRSEAVCVRLRKPEDGKTLPKYKYSLEELRDLESKLVLITGHDESAEREEVDRFLDTFHSVCWIADVLIQLQHYGNTQYIQWCLKFSCRMENIYDLLIYQVQNMENDLDQWLIEVKNERDKFYELNSFTTPQLLILREELGVFEASKDHRGELKQHVLNLLYSISKDLTSKSVSDILGQPDLLQSPVISIATQQTESLNQSVSQPAIGNLMPEKNTVSKEKTDETTIIEETKEETTLDYSKPCLALDDLPLDQRSLFFNLKDSFGYHSDLILHAFEHCTTTKTMEEDMSTWCEENQLNFEFPDEESDSIDSNTDDDDDDHVVSKDKPTTVPSSIADESVPTTYCPVVQQDDMKIKFEQHIETCSQLPLDKNHPIVKELLSLEFDVEQSIQAADKFPNNVSQAVHYLEQQSIAMEENSSVVKEDKVTYEEEAQVVELEKMRIEVLDVSSRNYMSLYDLGCLLRHLAAKYNAVVPHSRTLPEIIKVGECNLVVVPPESVLKTTLSLYMDEVTQLPLPTHEEVLICTEKTTAEEVTLLWKRAFDDPGNRRIFTLVHAELLSYQVCDSALRDLQQLSQDRKDYKIVIVCSNEEEEKSNIIAKLQTYRRPYQGIKADMEFQAYLKSYFIQANVLDQDNTLIKAAAVDKEKSRVRILSSTRAGMGKSFYIQKMMKKLSDSDDDNNDNDCYRVIPVHGPRVDADSLLSAFSEYLKYNNPDPCIYHIDVSQTVLRLMDTLLFNLLILGTVCNSKGQVWRIDSNDMYAIEVTMPPESEVRDICRSTVDFLRIMPIMECKSPKEFVEVFTSEEMGNGDEGKDFDNPSFQRVYEYLHRVEAKSDLDKFVYRGIKGRIDHGKCLQTLLDKFSVKDPSWSELKHFINFLNEQLECSEKSVFCNPKFIQDTLCGFKSFVVKFMIIMSKDFCTSSLKGEVALDTGKKANMGIVEKHEISETKKWHKNYHPYLFFNRDGFSLTFVGFTVTLTGNVVDPIKNHIIMRNAIKSDLYQGLMNQGVSFEENYYTWNKQTMIEKIGMVMGIEHPTDPDPSYVLTPDNVIKILAIQMKFRCNIPVVIMGETGCGKTRLIRYMCDLAAQSGNKKKLDSKTITNMLIMKVHGGINPLDISRMVKRAENTAYKNKAEYGIDTVLFFDEANTTDAIGLIKEVMCDRRLNGKPIADDLKFIAACNPYRKHHNDMISKLESAGLGFYVKATEAQEKLGEIPLRQLVYRVFDLPPSMRPLIYDFGRLDDKTEDKYTRQMVKDHCGTIDELVNKTDVIDAVADVLTWSQSYMKKRTDECSFVSLRDVERALIVFKHFFVKRDLYFNLIKAKAGNSSCVGRATWALIMSLSVCYHARLQDREKYEKEAVKQFNLKPILKEMEGIPDHELTQEQSKVETNSVLAKQINSKPSLKGMERVSISDHQEFTEMQGLTIYNHQELTQEQFKLEIKWCQDILLDHMTLGSNIARNAALRENVFMMAICIQLKIPLFLVGKPGSSKSLAKSIIADSLNHQTTDFLKDFNEVHMFSYQCSQLSTSESVIEVFTTARKFQKDQKNTKFTSVVVLDEVGLAEDSPNLPLKALHPLLEDGTEGTEDQQIIAREHRVAFIGISNWALDPAKMNRGVMVTRADPNENELIVSAEQICTSDSTSKKADGTSSSDDTDVVKNLLKPYFHCLAQAYTEICEKQNDIKKSFFGLRDFYSLIKMLYFMCKATKCHPTDKQLEHAIKRNFGGFKTTKIDTYTIFETHLKEIEIVKIEANKDIDQEILSPDCSPLGLIEKSLRTKTDELSQMGDSRYLLFLTENYAALQVLQHKLREAVGISKQQKEKVQQGLEEELTEKQPKATQRKKEPFVLFGSSFPKDREYTQVCRNINQIKICMETGRTVILLNLENLYESLYDLLNQYYIILGSSRYVDLGLQTHRVKCRVDNDFKLILIAERENVYRTFPTPLINRLEKHFVLTETILLDWQLEILTKLRDWIEKFSEVAMYSFSTENAIVGYQPDTPAAVIFQATKLKKEELGLVSDKELDAKYYDEVQKKSHYLLLQMASPDALIRLKHTKLKDEQEELCEIYFEQQKHNCLTDYVKNQLVVSSANDGISVQITTHSHLLSSLELEEVYKTLSFKMDQTTCFLLQEFDTELDFTKALDSVFSKSTSEERLLIIQCDSGHLYGDLIASARYRIDDQREKAHRRKEKTNDEGITHVILIVHLPRYTYARTTHHKNLSFIGFQGGTWTSAHIDDIHVTSYSGITLNDAMSSTMSQLFYNMPFNPMKYIDPPYAGKAYTSLLSAFSEQEGDDDVVSTDVVSTDENEYSAGKDMSSGETDKRKETEQVEHNIDYGLDSSVEKTVGVGNVQVEEHMVDERQSDHENEELQLDSNNPANNETSGDAVLDTVLMDTLDRDDTTDKTHHFEIKIEDIEEPEDSETDSVCERPGVDTDDDELNTDEEMEETCNSSDEERDEEMKDKFSTDGEGHSTNEELEREQSTDEEKEIQVTIDDNKAEDSTQIDEPSEGEEEHQPTSPHCGSSMYQFLDLDHLTVPDDDGGKDYTQCSRLHFCIQSVIAMIAERDEAKRDWAAKRVKLLLELIPEKQEFPIGIETFYGALIWRILRVLKERESTQTHSDWVVEEACNVISLQSGGTFQNVLARKIDRVLIPLFANILAFSDCYYNLEIIRFGKSKSLTLTQQLWLRLFNHPDICSFTQFSTNPSVRSTTLLYTLKQDFKCQFPFFWVIQEMIYSQWQASKTDVGTSMKEVHSTLHQLLLPTALAKALCIIPHDQIESYCQLYLHDFMRTVHHPTHSLSALEIEVLDAAIYTVSRGPNLLYSDHQSLLSRIIAIHVVYDFHQKEIMWLGQLTSMQPGLVEHLKQMDAEGYNTYYIDIHLFAVRFAFLNLELPLDPSTKHAYPERNLRLQTCQNIISSILEGTEQVPLAAELRDTWNYIRIVKLFVEHVALKYPDLIVYANRMKTTFKKKCDCSELVTLKKIQTTLTALQKESKKKNKIKNVMPDIVKRCKAFLSEVISTIFFGQHYIHPEPDLISALIHMVFEEHREQVDITESIKSTDRATAAPPVMRSFLLQLLLDYNTEDVMKHLNDYILKSRMVIQEEHSICLLCVQCLEDAIFKKVHISSVNRNSVCIWLLQESGSLMKRCGGQDITIEYLEAVAKIRFVCFSVTEMLYAKHLSPSGLVLTIAEKMLLQALKDTCSDQGLNDTTSGPGIFMMKQISRQHGLSFLGKVRSMDSCDWIIPTHLRKTDQKKPIVKRPDPFIGVYDEYSSLYETFKDAMLSQDLKKITDKCQHLGTRGLIVMLMALYQVVTMSYGYPNGDSRIVSDKFKTGLLSYIRKNMKLDREMIVISEALINCTHCKKLVSMRPSFDQDLMQNRQLTEVIVHAATVFQARMNLFIFKPFVHLLRSPEKLMNSYLPTCPGSQLNPSVVAALGGAFNNCPRGHPYFIDKCGDLTKTHKCPECGIEVPVRTEEDISLKLKLKLGNKDQSLTGYILGDPFGDQQTISAERNLSAPSCAIIRTLMNACLTWTASVNVDCTKDLIYLTKSKIPAQDLSAFFFQHFNNNIKALSKLLGKNEDEVCLLLHLILKQTATDNQYPNTKKTNKESELQSEEDRAKWENSFNLIFIQPILAELTGYLNKANTAISSYESQDGDPLMYAIYEKVAIPPEAVIPRLWTYRPRITMETFFQELGLHFDQENNPKYPILHYLSNHNVMLQATQYLPEIVKLQQQLSEVYHRKIDKAEAFKTTVAEFINSFHSQSIQDKVKQYFKATKQAWELVKTRLTDYSRIGVSDKYIEMSWDMDTLPLVYIIPSLSGPGVCTNALLEGLVHAHNLFIDHCHYILKKALKNKKNIWADRQVLVKHVQHCHLVEYQQQLLSMVLSHCHYTLNHGQDQQLTYEFAALEKRFVDRFVHGRPTIKLEVMEVKYREEAYSIANVKRAVEPKNLNPREKFEIINELKTTQSLRSTLDIVEIIMGFMSSGRYKSNLKLMEFVTKNLKMKDQFPSKKALEYCNMEHTLCLWTILSVEMAKRLLRTDQEPFTGLNDDYLLPITHEDQEKKLNVFLQKSNVDEFLHFLFEFIEGFVKHSQDYIEGRWCLMETIINYGEAFEKFENSFPKCFLVGQVVSIWKKAANFQKTKIAD